MGGGSHWDVVVVGAGPAGSASAASLAALGWSVLLLDRARFPRPKPCGECINPGGVAALQRLGLLERVLACSPSPLEGWSLRTERGRRVDGRFAPLSTPGLGIPREVLDPALVEEAVARGVEFRDGVQVLEVDPGSEDEPGTLRVRSTTGGRDGEGPAGGGRDGGAEGAGGEGAWGGDGGWRGRGAAAGGGEVQWGRSVEQITARVVVAADGLRSTLARRLDMVERAPRLRKLSLTCRVRGIGPPRKAGILFLGPEGTVGVAPIHRTDPLWNVTVVVDPDRHGHRVKGDPRGFLTGALSALALGWTAPPTVEGGPWASGPFDWPSARGGTGRVLFVGDAAGYYDPLTGQGIYRALRSAELVSHTAHQLLRQRWTVVAAVRHHDQALRRAFRPGRVIQRLVEAVVSSDRPRDLALRHLARGTRLDTLIRVTGDAAPVRTLLHPSLWLPLREGPGTSTSECA